MIQTGDSIDPTLKGLLFLGGIATVAVFLVWFVTTLNMHWEQKKFHEEIRWRLDAIIELLKKKE